MRTHKLTKKKNTWTRRIFIQTMLFGLMFSGKNLRGGIKTPAQGGQDLSADASADIGTIYTDIFKYAEKQAYPLSFLSGEYSGISDYKQTVRAKVMELFHYSPKQVDPSPEVVNRWEFDDYIQEKVVFSTTDWLRVPAYVLIPKGFPGKRPAIVDLHSHGGMYVFGKEKVMPAPEGDHPAMVEYKKRVYADQSTSLQLCRRGYVVISIDTFYFSERRTMYEGVLKKYGWDRSRYSVETVEYLNDKLGRRSETLIKSLFWAGTTWQGIVHWDDMRTVDYLVSRPEVEPARVGCMGISMGGDRTDYLAGLDERIQCAVSAGWMSTLRPMIRSHVITHSHMHFLPGLTHYLDLPDVLGCMVPKPLLVLQCSRDALYPLEGMKESVRKLSNIYNKARAGEKFRSQFFDIPHRYSLEMQKQTFDWFDRWLKP